MDIESMSLSEIQNYLEKCKSNKAEEYIKQLNNIVSEMEKVGLEIYIDTDNGYEHLEEFTYDGHDVICG